MAEQRQTFRFRLPWLATAPAPAPAPRPPPQLSTAETQTPAQPTTTTPVQRSPVRPPGIAPAQALPPQPQALPSPEAQLPSPLRATTQSQVTPQPPSPSRAATQSQAASQPPSPSRATTQSRAVSQPPSPSRAATQAGAATQPLSPSRITPQPSSPSPSRVATQSRAAIQPPLPSRVTPQPSSPSRKVSETQPGLQAASQPQSPPKLASQPAVQTSSLPSSPSLTATQAQSAAGAITQPAFPPEKLQPTTQKGSQPPPSSTEPPSSVSQEPKPARSQPKSQELQPKKERTSENVLNSQNQTPNQMTVQPNRMPTQPSEASVPTAVAALTSTAVLERPVHTQQSDSSLLSAESKPLLESNAKSEETIKRKEVVQELGSKQKINIVSEEPKERTVTEILTLASGSKVPTKTHPSVAFDAGQKLLEKEEIPSRKDTLATSSSNGKQTKTVVSHPRDKNTVNISHHKPTITNGERVPLHEEIRNDISKFAHKMATQHPKLPMYEKPVSIVTLAGENRGASMHLGSESTKKEVAIHIRRGYKINPDESTEATTDGEGNSRGRRSKDSKTEEDQSTKAYINSNIQGINNSIMFSSSITERNPGVQFTLSRNMTKPDKETTAAQKETIAAQKETIAAQKQTYQPTVRRRCLRGLFMESSDSDPDNPEKPRRHGCRYACKENNKGNK